MPKQSWETFKAYDERLARERLAGKRASNTKPVTVPEPVDKKSVTAEAMYDESAIAAIDTMITKRESTLLGYDPVRSGVGDSTELSAGAMEEEEAVDANAQALRRSSAERGFPGVSFDDDDDAAPSLPADIGGSLGRFDSAAMMHGSGGGGGGGGGGDPQPKNFEGGINMSAFADNALDLSVTNRSGGGGDGGKRASNDGGDDSNESNANKTTKKKKVVRAPSSDLLRPTRASLAKSVSLPKPAKKATPAGSPGKRVFNITTGRVVVKKTTTKKKKSAEQPAWDATAAGSGRRPKSTGSMGRPISPLDGKVHAGVGRQTRVNGNGKIPKLEDLPSIAELRKQAAKVTKLVKPHVAVAVACPTTAHGYFNRSPVKEVHSPTRSWVPPGIAGAELKLLRRTPPPPDGRRSREPDLSMYDYELSDMEDGGDAVEESPLSYPPPSAVDYSEPRDSIDATYAVPQELIATGLSPEQAYARARAKNLWAEEQYVTAKANNAAANDAYTAARIRKNSEGEERPPLKLVVSASGPPSLPARNSDEPEPKGFEAALDKQLQLPGGGEAHFLEPTAVAAAAAEATASTEVSAAEVAEEAANDERLLTSEQASIAIKQAVLLMQQFPKELDQALNQATDVLQSADSSPVKPARTSRPAVGAERVSAFPRVTHDLQGKSISPLTIGRLSPAIAAAAAASSPITPPTDAFLQRLKGSNPNRAVDDMEWFEDRLSGVEGKGTPPKNRSSNHSKSPGLSSAGSWKFWRTEKYSLSSEDYDGALPARDSPVTGEYASFDLSTGAVVKMRTPNKGDGEPMTPDALPKVTDVEVVSRPGSGFSDFGDIPMDAFDLPEQAAVEEEQDPNELNLVGLTAQGRQAVLAAQGAGIQGEDLEDLIDEWRQSAQPAPAPPAAAPVPPAAPVSAPPAEDSESDDDAPPPAPPSSHPPGSPSDSHITAVNAPRAPKSLAPLTDTESLELTPLNSPISPVLEEAESLSPPLPLATSLPCENGSVPLSLANSAGKNNVSAFIESLERVTEQAETANANRSRSSPGPAPPKVDGVSVSSVVLAQCGIPGTPTQNPNPGCSNYNPDKVQLGNAAAISAEGPEPDRLLTRAAVGRDVAETPILEDEEKPAGSSSKTSRRVAHGEAEGEEDDEWC